MSRPADRVPDRVFIVRLWGGDHLTEKGWDELTDTWDELEGIINDAVVEHMGKRLPDYEVDRHGREGWIDWYRLQIEDADPRQIPERTGPCP